MIHLFNGKKRILFFPVGFANSVARWILGVHSPSGTISIKNTATPGDNGSIALDVNVDALRRIMAGVIDDHDLTEREIKRTKDIVHGAIDGTSLIMGGEHISVSMDWLQQNILKFIGDDTEITHDKITDWGAATAGFLTDDDYDTLSGAITDLSDIVDGILADYLSTADIGVTVAAKDHTHSDYAAKDHTHGFITADGKLSNCKSAGCLVVTDSLGRITHSDSNPLASDVADLVKQWIDNDRKIGGGGDLTHNDITDWASATAGFATDEDLAALDAAFDSLSGIVEGLIDTCLTQDDIGVTVAEKNHTHTTANISDWGTATANFLTDADMSAYALDSDLALLEQDVAELADYVESMDQDIADLTVWYGTGIGGSFNIVTNVEWTGSVLRMRRKSVTFTNGLITAIGNDSTVTIDTPVLFEQS